MAECDWSGYFIYARKELPEGSMKKIVVWPPRADFLNPEAQSLFTREDVVHFLRFLDPSLSLHKIRGKMKFVLELRRPDSILADYQQRPLRVLTICPSDGEALFRVTLCTFTNVLFKKIEHTTHNVRTERGRTLTLHRHCFKTFDAKIQDNTDNGASKACRKFLATLRNWGKMETRRSVENVFDSFLYHPPETKKQSFSDFVDSLSGTVEMMVSSPSKEIKGFCFERNGTMYMLESFAYISSIVPSLIEHCQYYQLDASFYVFSDYVYCVPQFVFANSAIPAGLMISRSENAGLYTSLLRGIRRLAALLEMDELNRKFCLLPYLSDDHMALHSYGTANHIKQFLCHRHIIERHGANSMIAICVRILLDTYSDEEFLKQLQLTNQIIQIRFQKLTSGRESFLDAIKKYASFSGQTAKVVENMIVFTQLPGYKQEIEKWGLWYRKGVSSCSNHAESFHRTLNAMIRTRGGKPHFDRAFRTVMSVIEQKQKRWNEYAARNLQDQFRKARKFSGEVVQVPCPLCSYGMKIRDRYSVEAVFPCHHMTAEKQLELFQIFSREVNEKISAVHFKQEDVKSVIVTQVPSLVTDEKDKSEGPSTHKEQEDIDQKGHQFLKADEIYAEQIALACYRHFKKKFSFHWTLVWVLEEIQQIAPLEQRLPEAYEAAIAMMERRARKHH